MSKTIEIQTEKSRALISGMTTNIASLKEYGVTEDELKRMATQLDALDRAGKECDNIRAMLTEKTREMNAILTEVKETYASMKRIVKTNFAQEQWIRYGVSDKR